MSGFDHSRTKAMISAVDMVSWYVYDVPVCTRTKVGGRHVVRVVRIKVGDASSCGVEMLNIASEMK
jgi:hypothetical protein